MQNYKILLLQDKCKAHQHQKKLETKANNILISVKMQSQTRVSYIVRTCDAKQHTRQTFVALSTSWRH